LSTSLTEFWRRWHISLSTWFRDYIYIPMGGNKVSTKKMFFTILLVFFLSGLWHGAKYTFIVLAMIHAIFLISEHLLKERNEKPGNIFSRIIKITYVFLITTIAWVFFRSQTVDEAVFVINKLFAENSPYWEVIPKNFNEIIFS